MNRILCTGNPNKIGIAKAVSEVFSNVDYISLSTNYDLTSNAGQEKFRSIIKNYNLFINISQLSNNSQEKLLKIAHEEGFKGHVFNIGSIAEYNRWEWYNSEYTAEKRQLRETSLDLCSEFFTTTHIIVGGFRDSSNADPGRMDPAEIVKIIQYVLQSPVNIPIVGIEKLIDTITEEQLNDKLQNT